MSASHPSDKTAEQEARDMLERMGIEDAQSFSSGDLVELANLIAAPSPAPSDGYLSPELEREYQSIVASHYEDIPPAAPSVEARDADRESIAQTLWIGFGLHVEKLGFHNDPESALRAASLIAQYAALLPPETT